MDTIPIDDDLLFASVEYRLALEHRAPTAALDCYAAAVYLAEHATELGIDVSKIVIYGISGGAAPAAATCILARDRQYPPIRAQMLSMPMLDDRDIFPSVKQFVSGTNWMARKNHEAWNMVLGPDRGEPTDIQVPARVTDLSNLPPAFIDVGECDVLQDSAVAYASQLWSHGTSCELHVWPGMYHAGYVLEPEVPVSKAAAIAQKNWLARVLAVEDFTLDCMRNAMSETV
jgi:acetyl esterase/lipase